ncbi:MAG TPA: hypothetical protein DHW14_02620 [Clostridiales bacterium]|nr:hypothetical protein [Clostridiales bacterium]
MPEAPDRPAVPFSPRLAVTGIGSLPHLSADEGAADVVALCPDFPYWPQFPRLSAAEDMYRQFSRGLPGVRLEPTGRAGGGPAVRWRRDEQVQAELERVYTDVLEAEEAQGGGPGGSDRAEGGTPEGADGVLERWALGPHEACGLAALERALERARREGAAGGRPPVVPVGLKGQTTGPVSLGLTVKDDSGRALLYEEDLMDGVVRGLALRARWQEAWLRETAGRLTGGDADPQVLLSVDEPYLGTFGSAYFPYTPEVVAGYLEVFDEALDAVWGVHCCDNTDWEFILSSPVRFVSFDAYAHGSRVVLYPKAVKDFLAAGKVLLWGIVPTDPDRLGSEDAESLARRCLGLLETLVGRGVPEDSLVRQSMVTPACGLAGLSVEEARRAMRLAVDVSRILRCQCGDI